MTHYLRKVGANIAFLEDHCMFVQEKKKLPFFDGRFISPPKGSFFLDRGTPDV